MNNEQKNVSEKSTATENAVNIGCVASIFIPFIMLLTVLTYYTATEIAKWIF